MQVVYSLIYQVSPLLLQPLFLSLSSNFKEINWNNAPELLVTSIQEVIDGLPTKERFAVSDVLSRLHEMTDYYHHHILTKFSQSQNKLHELSSALERCCWIYVKEQKIFHHVESICRSRNNQTANKLWGNYLIGELVKGISYKGEKIDEFNNLLKSILGDGTRVNTHIYQRKCNHILKGMCTETHVVINYSQFSERYASLDSNGIKNEFKNYSLQCLIIYTDMTERIEVLAESEELRSVFAHAFSSCFLNIRNIAVEQFVLADIINKPSLLCDPGDGDMNAKITRIKFQESEWNSYLEIDFPPLANNQCDLQLYAEQCFSSDNPFTSNLFRPTEVSITIFLSPTNYMNREPKKLIPISVSLPNLCNLRNFSDEDRMRSVKCLHKWGIVK